jgi:hypothetical protein
VWLAATDTGAGQDTQTAIILAVIGLLTVVLGAAVTGLFALWTARTNRADQVPGPTGVNFHDYVVGELAKLQQRADNADSERSVIDRRLDQHERALDIDNPDWRHRDL